MNTHVVLPAELGECDRVDVLVEYERERDREVEHVEALRAQRVRQDFNRIRDDEGAERDSTPFASVCSQAETKSDTEWGGRIYHSRIARAEQENHRDHSM